MDVLGSQPWKCAPARKCSERLPEIVSGQEKKDIATPKDADTTMESRLRKRAKRDSKPVVLVVTKAMRLKNSSISECQSKQDRHIWRQVQATRERPLVLEKICCSLCWTDLPDHCPCGVSLIHACVEDKLAEYGAFFSFWSTIPCCVRGIRQTSVSF